MNSWARKRLLAHHLQSEACGQKCSCFTTGFLQGAKAGAEEAGRQFVRTLEAAQTATPGNPFAGKTAEVVGENLIHGMTMKEVRPRSSEDGAK